MSSREPSADKSDLQGGPEQPSETPSENTGTSPEGAQGGVEAQPPEPGVIEGAGPSAGGSAGADGEVLQELKATHEALNDRHLRLVAEFDNFRRRVNQERMEMWARAQADLVGKLLDTLDDLQRVSDLDPSTASTVSVLEGVELVERKFLRTLTEVGAEELNPDGGPFDPNIMEAVMRSPTDDPELDDHVHQVFQKGYQLKGNLVRPARVSVYKLS